MKLSDLLDNRDKLRKYDELKEALDGFRSVREKAVDPGVITTIDFPSGRVTITRFVLSRILTALESEIAKLDEE